MNRRKRYGSSEINLTPLLDVLFTILFIVMLGSARNEEVTKENARLKISDLQSQISELEKDVTFFKDSVDSFDLYTQDAVVISISNGADGEEHILMISDGVDNMSYETIKLGSDRVTYVRSRLSGMVSEVLEKTDNQPIYIVFHCDKTVIYTTEYSAIDSELRRLQDTYKAVFYKIVSEVKENEQKRR